MARLAVGKSMVMMIVVAALLVALIGGVAVFVLKGKKPGKGESKEPAKPMALGEFVVNLADQGQLRYLKADVVLGVRGNVESGEGSKGDPRVRDAVIEVLSSKHYSELITPEGKDRLKAQILAAVNKRVEGIEAVDVYFNEFAMQ